MAMAKAKVRIETTITLDVDEKNNFAPVEVSRRIFLLLAGLGYEPTPVEVQPINAADSAIIGHGVRCWSPGEAERHVLFWLGSANDSPTMKKRTERTSTPREERAEAATGWDWSRQAYAITSSNLNKDMRDAEIIVREPEAPGPWELVGPGQSDGHDIYFTWRKKA